MTLDVDECGADIKVEETVARGLIFSQSPTTMNH